MTEENGTRPIDKIRQAARDKRRSVEVEDWGLELYFRPLTTADVEAVDAAMEDDGKDPDKHRQDRRLRLLVEKAEVEDGSKAFQPGDLHYLKSEADYVILQQVVGFMYRSAVSLTDESVEQAKKDSAKSPTSASD